MGDAVAKERRETRRCCVIRERDCGAPSCAESTDRDRPCSWQESSCVPPPHRKPDDEYAALVEEFNRKLNVARDTSDWREVIAPGKRPVMYQMRQIKASQFDWCQGTMRRLRLAELEATALLFRLALSQVDGLEGAHFKEREPFEGQLLAPIDVYDAIVDALGRAPIVELGDIVFARCTQPIRPLS